MANSRLDNLDPFLPDANVPEVSSTGDDGYSFDSPSTSSSDYFRIGDDQPLPPPRRVTPWKIIGIVAVVIAIIVGAIAIVPGLLNPPDRFVHTVYDEIEANGFANINSYIDPYSLVQATKSSIFGKLLEKIEGWIGRKIDLDVEIDLGFDFQDLSFDVVENKGDVATVRVQGKVRVFEKSLDLGITLPYDFTHYLIKRGDHWYLRILDIPR
jgi:hypothetical protein